MEFASSHVLNYDVSDEEYIDDEELEQDLREGSYSELRSPEPQREFTQSAVTYDLHLQDTTPSMPSMAPPAPPVTAGAAGDSAYDNLAPETQTRGIEAEYDNLSSLPKELPPKKPPRQKKKKKGDKKREEEHGGYANPYDVPKEENTYASIGEGSGRAVEPPPLPARTFTQKATPEGGAARGKKHKYRRADTNIISVKFDSLVKPSHMHTGDVMKCEGCSAVLSSVSNLSDSGDGGKIWRCEFCDHVNRADLDDEEIPKKNDVTYLIKPSPATVDPAGYFGDDSNIIFCVDISGSMCVTTEVPGMFPLRANDSTRALELYNTSPDIEQYMPYQRRDVSYVSRLQAMQSAVDHNLSKLFKDCPTKRIGLVTFNNEVTVISDGVDEPVVIAGDRLYDKDSLTSLGSQVPVPRFVRETRTILGDKVFNLEEGGQTALGPAVLVSVALASQKPGSKVIVCTDGKANIGLGSLDCEDSDIAYDYAAAFYEDLGNYARDHGVTVSVLTLEGTDCRMVELGNIADKTGGQVSIVDPLKLKDQFGEILADPVIATNVTAKLRLHRGLYFRNEESVHDNYATRTIGNVTADSEITFEFGVRKKSDLQKKENVLYDNKGGMEVIPESSDEPVYDVASEDVAAAQQSALEGIDKLPFQLEIQYTSRDEAECLRVITQDRPVTNDRDLVVENLNAPVYSAHTAQTTAAMAMDGEYTQAQLNAITHKKLIQKHAEQKRERHNYDAFVFNIAPMARGISSAQHAERNMYGHNLSDDEEEISPPAMGSTQAPAKAKKGKLKLFSKKAVQRRKTCSDSQASVMYKMKSANSKMFSS
ncbi:circularly permutated Ras protein 1-like [Ptychodera flava]|uniref:circularly permutated Ras protein 1-like n=1 Tax=Ptychodera flava TaxID=63121 RepID=UPI00396A3107